MAIRTSVAGNSPGPGPGCQFVRHGPDLAIDRQLGQHASKLTQDLLFACPAGAVPEFELNQRAPTGLPVLQSGFNTRPDIVVTLRAKQVYPGRSVNEDQLFNPVGDPPEPPPA